ncbi:MAG: FAD-dependent oxidoreductase [Alphaproteobacteria bacterium]|jgi:fumarate reductase flavoprotein subunit|nr:3-ketosteroid dehydrogenase [Rhodospirillaceae bacterium]MDP6407305.1 FAD-dependent oxidoreductase [Alphaproteobacteria bacterium]MDP6621023.1 FAD-dependent oxidoreductase [Alphaproteobacteria bacterium]
MSILPPPDGFDLTVPLAVIGAGACGSVAALAAREAGAEVLVLERDALPAGSTALSSGMIPACGTHWQRAAGVDDTVDILAADIQAKAGNQVEPAIVETVCRESGPAVEWLAERHAVPIELVDGFLYPGHSRLRMHAPPSRTGAELMGSLSAALAAAQVDVITEAQVSDLFAEPDGRVRGLRFQRPDGSHEDVGCGALVLACCGFAGSPELVSRHIPEMRQAMIFGHVGNQGDAVLWGEAMGAELRHMGAYQGHGSIAEPHAILVTWALMMRGGIQINVDGRRFSNEHEGYSEQAVTVLTQPSGLAWNLYDQRLHELGLEFDDYRSAQAAGAVRQGATAAALAESCGLPVVALTETINEAADLAAGQGSDSFGRDFTAAPALAPPYFAIKVTGALLHTQGGLRVDTGARVLRPDGTALPNLFAGGGAACGVSGPAVWGYLSGNGLLSAVTLGRIAGRGAAVLVEREGKV